MSTSATVAKRPQLAADELRQLRWMLGGLLTVLALATVVYIDVDAWILLVITVTVTVATTFWPTLPARVPRAVHLLAFPFIAAFFTLDLWLKSELLPAMVRLDMLLLLYRVLVYRQRRDDLQVIVLGLFLVVVAGVLTVSLLFAAQILVYTACALTLLFVITLSDATTANAARGASSLPESAEPGRGASIPAWAAHTNWGRLLARVRDVLDWRVVALSAVLFVGVIAVSGLLFLVIPRFQLDNGMFLDRFITRKARTGFSDTIKVGDVTEILQDTSVALHVDVSDPSEIPPTPYWRMVVLNEYDNGTFRLSRGLHSFGFDRERSGTMIMGRMVPRPSRAIWTFYLEPGVSRYLPLLGEFQQLRFGEAQNFQRTRGLGVVALTKDPVTMTAYQVQGFDLSSPLGDAPSRYYGGLSATLERRADTPDDAALERIDAGLTRGEQLSAVEFAARTCDWLRNQHPYSLTPAIPPGPGDPLVRWLQSKAAGHCELFAGSFVLLARAAGYPARVVTGFRGGSWNAFSRSFTVRNSDAHAWAEIYDRTSQTWLRADPLEVRTAAEVSANGEGALARRTDRSWSARLDSVRVFWYRRIVNFDQAAQVNTLKAAKEVAQNGLLHVRYRIERWFAAIRDWWRAPWDAGRLTSLITLTLIAAAFTWRWRRWRLSWLQMSSRRGGGKREDPIRREAGRWLRRVSEATPPQSAAQPVVAELQRLRYGARETWPDALAVFRCARAALRARRTERRRVTKS